MLLADRLDFLLRRALVKERIENREAYADDFLLEFTSLVPFNKVPPIAQAARAS